MSWPITAAVAVIAACILIRVLVIDARNRRQDDGQVWFVVTRVRRQNGVWTNDEHGPFHTRKAAVAFCEEYNNEFKGFAVVDARPAAVAPHTSGA